MSSDKALSKEVFLFAFLLVEIGSALAITGMTSSRYTGIGEFNVRIGGFLLVFYGLYLIAPFFVKTVKLWGSITKGEKLFLIVGLLVFAGSLVASFFLHRILVFVVFIATFLGASLFYDKMIADLEQG